MKPGDKHAPIDGRSHRRSLGGDSELQPGTSRVRWRSTRIPNRHRARAFCALPCWSRGIAAADLDGHARRRHHGLGAGRRPPRPARV